MCVAPVSTNPTDLRESSGPSKSGCATSTPPPSFHKENDAVRRFDTTYPVLVSLVKRERRSRKFDLDEVLQNASIRLWEQCLAGKSFSCEFAAKWESLDWVRVNGKKIGALEHLNETFQERPVLSYNELQRREKPKKYRPHPEWQLRLIVLCKLALGYYDGRSMGVRSGLGSGAEAQRPVPNPL